MSTIRQKQITAALKNLDNYKPLEVWNKKQDFSEELGEDANHIMNLTDLNDLFFGNKMVNNIVTGQGQTVRVFERYIIDYDKGIFEIDYTDFSNGPYEIIQATQNGKYFDIIIQTQITAQKWIYTDKEPEKNVDIYWQPDDPEKEEIDEIYWQPDDPEKEEIDEIYWQPYDPEKEEIDEKPELLSTTKINNNDYVWSSVDDGEEEELIKEVKKPEEPIDVKKVFADLMNKYGINESKETQKVVEEVKKPKETLKPQVNREPIDANKIFTDLMKEYGVNESKETQKVVEKKPEKKKETVVAKKVFADLMNDYVEKPKDEKKKKETNKIFSDLMKKYDINQ